MRAWLLVVLAGCYQVPQQPEWERHAQKMNEITALWTQIRGFRADMGMPLDPSPATENQIQPIPPKDAGRVCAENHAVPKTCEDNCTLRSRCFFDRAKNPRTTP